MSASRLSVMSPVVRASNDFRRAHLTRASTTRKPVLQLLMGSGLFGLLGDRNKWAAAASTYPATPAQVLEDPQWPEAWPFKPEHFERFDETSDVEFYSYPRFVTHIDDAAIGALTDFYSQVFPATGQKDVAVLDICSSWISHYPAGYTAGRISGLGMNEEELARNKVLTDFVVKDLNKEPILPYDNNTFDIVTNAVSVDYLNKPLQVFKEINRVLKPGGLAIMSFSNRCFPTKAISLWTATGDVSPLEH